MCNRVMVKLNLPVNDINLVKVFTNMTITYLACTILTPLNQL